MSARMHAVLSVSAVLLAGACASPKPQAETPRQVLTTVAVRSATITGKLLALGGPAPGAPRAMSGTITLINVETHDRHDVQTSEDGSYSASTRPGTYEVQGHSPQYGSGKYLCQALKRVSVAANRSSTVDVYCQEK